MSEECPETLKDAKDRAKYLLSDDYQVVAEMSQPLAYARVMCGDECVADFFRR